MIHWYRDMYMDEKVKKNPARCKRRVERRRPWKKNYYAVTLPFNEKNLFEIMGTRQLFFRRYRYLDMYVVGLAASRAGAIELLQRILEKGYGSDADWSPRDAFDRKKDFS